MASLLAHTLYFLFPFACVLAIPPSRRAGSFAERLVLGVALYELLLLGIGLALGSASCLKPQLYRAAIGGTLLLLVAQALRNGFRAHRFRAGRFLKTRRGVAALLLGGVAAAACLLELAFDFQYGTRHGDGLWYHVPRVMFWLEHGNFSPWDTPVVPSIGLPVGADLILLHRMLLGLGWAGAAYATLPLTTGAVACVYLGGLELGLKKWHALLASLLFASFPAVGLRVWSANSDIAAAFPVLASFVLLHRLRVPGVGLSVFLLLNAMAIACKLTVAPPAAVLAGIALFRCRHKLASAWREALPSGAAAVGALVVLASFWPVYQTFGDFLGADYTRLHRSADSGEFLYAVGMHAAYWILEPLGYLTRFRTPFESEALKTIYNAVGAHFQSLPEMWKPYPGQDSGYTGLAPALVIPFLLAGLPNKWRWQAAAAFVALYVPLSGLIRPQPYFTRYNVVVLALVALFWGGAKVFARGKTRWLLAGAVFLNLSALLGVVCANIYLQTGKWSQPGGLYFYISDEDRRTLAASLAGRPLLVMTEAERVSSLDALLPGPNLAFALRYVICPSNGTWADELRRLSAKSNWMAFIHNGGTSIIAGPAIARPGCHACSEVPKSVLENALAAAGWSRYKDGRFVDLWTHP